jgi:hypothetical protein
MAANYCDLQSDWDCGKIFYMGQTSHRHITRRQATAFLALASIVTNHSVCSAETAPQRVPFIRYPGFLSPLMKAKILPGKTLRGLGFAHDDWDEFWVEAQTDGGFHEKQWSEKVEPQFVEAGGSDLRSLDRNALRQAQEAFFRDDIESNLQSIYAAKGGPVTQAYQRLLRALRNNDTGEFLNARNAWQETLQEVRAGRIFSEPRPPLSQRPKP